MSTWQSELMSHGTIVLPVDRSKEYVLLLGRQCNLQFNDMNEHSFQRPYRKFIQRIDETERIIRSLKDQIDNLPGAEYENKQFDTFLKHSSYQYKLDDVEDSLHKLNDQFIRFRDNNKSIVDEKIAAIEQRNVALVAANSIASSFPFGGESGSLVGQSIGFTAVAGVIVQEDIERFSRAIYRTTRGNAYSHFESVVEQAEEIEEVPKSVFVLIFQGSAESAIYEKVLRIITGYDATVYNWPRSQVEAEEMARDLSVTIAGKTKAIQSYDEFFVQEIAILLEAVRPGGNSLIGEWELFIVMEKATYAALDLFEGVAETQRCDVWFPTYEESNIRSVLSSRQITDTPGAFLIVDSIAKENPPTFFRNTDFTLGFQNFVNTYGVPRYREINPAVMTSVTLPYLFGVMYGDIGHGLFILAAGLTIIAMYPKMKGSDDEMVQMFLGGRYMITLMGIFAVYAGFLYNDFFSIGLDLFSSRYVFDHASPAGDKGFWSADLDQNFPYPFGFDPVWKGAENELTFQNSFKMKFSILVAGLHMGMGVILKGANTVNGSDFISFFFEFLPQMCFFLLFVGYIDFLIIYKWIWPGSAPGLINSIIEFAMFTTPAQTLYTGQAFIQKAMFLGLVLCVPWMLIPKPLLLKKHHDRLAKVKNQASRQREEHRDAADLELSMLVESEMKGTEIEDEEFDFGEEFIHQLIETIEFVLGAVSNTASYLRLWALSLAHQQLAVVFFEMTIMKALDLQGSSLVGQTIMLWFMFAAFGVATVMVMLCMDSLECYLHALRLQWVEFQSKFFKADGYDFRPFRYESILKGTQED
eukprot:GHVH01015210.1.p1 GENE.GHVH01015210.1~~GHVH01015210.1.p1  ORF type:complete len:811 (+),score=140.61 GHVH01015210.1:2498-4930(+)